MPRLAGYRRLIVCAVVLCAALASAGLGWLASPDLAAVMLAIVAGFAAPDAVEKAMRRKEGQ
jgi:hypothetical protein